MRMVSFGEYAPDAVTSTLKASDHKHATDLVMTGRGIRRLTPAECESLQGFPAGWTDGNADCHRWKQTGNAVAVPVVKWLVEGMTR